MATVYYFLPKNAPLTAKEKAELDALKDRPIVYDEDCPPMTGRQLDEMDYLIRKYKTSCITKEILTAEFPERFSKQKAAS